MQKGLLALVVAAAILSGCAHAPSQGTTAAASPLDAPTGAAHSNGSSPTAAPSAAPSAAPRPNSGAIHGVVVDEAVRPLAANVTLVERDETQVTVGGSFRFDRLAAGIYTLKVRAPGYVPQNLVVSTEGDDAVRIQMAALRGARAYNTTMHFHGHIECAMEALIITPSCDTLLADPRVGGPSLFKANFSALLPLDPSWRTVVADVAFDPASAPLLDGLHVTVRGSHNSSALAEYEQYGRFSGAQPFQFRVEPGMSYPDGTSAVPENTTLFKMDVYPQGMGYHAACVPPGEGGTCFLGVGAGQDFEFDLYLTVFYVDPAPAGFKAV
ncbi:MAG: Carboxypeptidase regulatory-like domain [Thermoplasmata archaeon]|jgi:hypothetical protein|nr:Carboxypeptidase regulatory-like domain [Thermoplasmata archaeon]